VRTRKLRAREIRETCLSERVQLTLTRYFVLLQGGARVAARAVAPPTRRSRSQRRLRRRLPMAVPQAPWRHPARQAGRPMAATHAVSPFSSLQCCRVPDPGSTCIAAMSVGTFFGSQSLQRSSRAKLPSACSLVDAIFLCMPASDGVTEPRMGCCEDALPRRLLAWVQAPNHAAGTSGLHRATDRGTGIRAARPGCDHVY